jgi:hypothetical protein
MTFVFWHITPKRNSRYDNVTKQTKDRIQIIIIFADMVLTRM